MSTEQPIPMIPDVVGKEVLDFIKKQSRPIGWLDIASQIRPDDSLSQVKDSLRTLIDLGYVRKVQGEERAVMYEWVDPDSDLPF